MRLFLLLWITFACFSISAKEVVIEKKKFVHRSGIWIEKKLTRVSFRVRRKYTTVHESKNWKKWYSQATSEQKHIYELGRNVVFIDRTSRGKLIVRTFWRNYNVREAVIHSGKQGIETGITGLQLLGDAIQTMRKQPYLMEPATRYLIRVYPEFALVAANSFTYIEPALAVNICKTIANAVPDSTHKIVEKVLRRAPEAAEEVVLQAIQINPTQIEKIVEAAMKYAPEAAAGIALNTALNASEFAGQVGVALLRHPKSKSMNKYIARNVLTKAPTESPILAKILLEDPTISLKDLLMILGMEADHYAKEIAYHTISVRPASKAKIVREFYLGIPPKLPKHTIPEVASVLINNDPDNMEKHIRDCITLLPHSWPAMLHLAIYDSSGEQKHKDKIIISFTRALVELQEYSSSKEAIKDIKYFLSKMKYY